MNRALKRFLAAPPPGMKRKDRDTVAVYLATPTTERPLSVVQRMLGSWTRGHHAVAYIWTLCTTDHALSQRFGDAMDRLGKAGAIELIHRNHTFWLVRRGAETPAWLDRLLETWYAQLDGETR